MFKALISDTSLLKDSIDTVSQVITEGTFKITKEGINLKAADRAMVSVVDLKLDSAAFDAFETSEDVTIGVNIENLLQILKRAKSGDKVELKISDDKGKLHVNIIGNTSRKFSMPLLDLSEGDIPDIDKLQFTTIAQVKTSVVEEGIDDAYILSDSLLLKTEDEKLVMKTDGNSSTSEMIVSKDGGLVNLTGPDIQARYPLEYLKKMMKAGRISQVATLSMGKDFPLKMQFASPGKCSISFILAPRVEE